MKPIDGKGPVNPFEYGRRLMQERGGAKVLLISIRPSKEEVTK